MTQLQIRPITLRAANDYVTAHHRHAKAVRGHKFSIACHNETGLIGVAIIGRPVARALDNGTTAEILRVCTDGTPNACSKLYGAATRCCIAMGYDKIVTYTTEHEHGTSLKAANYTPTGTVNGRQWDTPTRPREHREHVNRTRWEYHQR